MILVIIVLIGLKIVICCLALEGIVALGETLPDLILPLFDSSPEYKYIVITEIGAPELPLCDYSFAIYDLYTESWLIDTQTLKANKWSHIIVELVNNDSAIGLYTN